MSELGKGSQSPLKGEQRENPYLVRGNFAPFSFSLIFKGRLSKSSLSQINPQDLVKSKAPLYSVIGWW